ncbi:hypothetical protein [Streptomyces sp. Inha503]|uniref:hypothetical protein n=1 Tax=Streptomyces sp. Inha503 TaxID=3383314 RepID=UPI0039A36E4C
MPEDMTSVIEEVYAELNDVADDALTDDRHRARAATQTAAADAAAIPAPETLTDRFPVTDRAIEAWTETPAARAGADPGQHVVDL